MSVATLVGVVLCVAVLVQAAAPLNPPLYVHLALSDSTSAMVVSWMTKLPTNTSVVKYGTSSGVYDLVAEGTSRSYHADAGYTHDVHIKKLKAGATYYYTCGDEEGGFSEEFHFNTNRNINQTQPEVIKAAVAMYGDMGVKNAAVTAAQLTNLVDKVDFYFHVGDISYANDYNSGHFEQIWNEWFILMKRVLPYSPYMVSPGNHEHASGQPILKYTEFFKVFNYRFKMPARADNNMWYSFDYGGIHFVSMSTETDYAEAPYAVKFGEQMKWFREDLIAATANRHNVPWIVVVGHRPMYTSVNHTLHPLHYTKPLQRAIEDLLHHHKVDLYVCGHVHNYERSYPIYNGTRTSTSYVNPSSYTHIIVGNAGCPEGITHHFLKEKPQWSAMRYDESTGYGVLRVNGASSLTWAFHRASDGALKDSFTITKT